MSSKVTSLKPQEDPVATESDEPEPKEPAPSKFDTVAVGSRFSFQLGGATLDMQTHFERDAPIEAWNETFDKMRAAGKRQALLVDLDSAIANLASQYREVRTANKRMVIAEAEYKAQTEARAAAVAKLGEDIEAARQHDKIDFARSKKRGDYQPNQKPGSPLHRLEQQRDGLLRSQEAADVDRDNAQTGSRAAMISYEQHIEHYREEIDRLQKLLGIEE